jgi:type VI secretion system protein ImpH
MGFAPAALSAFERGDDASPPRLLVRFFGLLGPNGPLPLHLTEFAHERALHHHDRTFARFLDLLHHRFLALFYRAWAQAQPTVSYDRPREDRFGDYVGALVGIGAAELKDRDAAGDQVKRFFSGWLSRQVRNAEGLAAILSGYFDLPVAIETYVGHWMALPGDDVTRLGAGNAGAQLGVGAVAGARVWDRQHKFRIRFGPLTLPQYEGFLPRGTALPRLVALVRQYFCLELDWDAQLVIARAEVPKTRLGQYGRLGWTTWLGPYRKPRDAADLTLDCEMVVGERA